MKHAPTRVRTKRRLLLAGTLSLLMVGAGACKERVPDMTPVEDPWGEARASLLDGPRCFAKRPEYCLSDPGFIDPIIQDVLDRDHQGKMPTTRDGVDAVIKRIGSKYAQACREPGAVQQIQTLVEARYGAPVERVEGAVAIADYGHVAGALRVFRREGINMAPSERVDAGQWASAEVGRALVALGAKHPDAETLELDILVPDGTRGTKALRYRYKRSSGRIRVEQAGSRGYSVGPAPDLGEIGKSVSVHTRDLSTCGSKPGSGELRDDCRW
jgi:hypothetical protein